MPLNYVFLSKQPAKKSNKQAPAASVESSNSEYEISSTSSGEVYEGTITNKFEQKGKAAEKEKGKKLVSEESKSSTKEEKESYYVSSLHTTTY